jgi:glycosyltransferase involved in cell wall biosynthesis
MNSPLVSIIMPCYNSESTILFAVASILCQTLENWECLIVDDGSTDTTAKKLDLVRDPRFKIYHNAANKGRSFSRQLALSNARGKYFAMLDADDWYYPRKLELQVIALDDMPKATLVACPIAIISSNSELRSVRRIKHHGTDSVPFDTIVNLLPFPCPPILIRMDSAKKTRFDESLILGQDFDFVTSVLLGGKYAVTHEILYAYDEKSSYKLRRVLMGYHYGRKALLKYLRKYPIRTLLEVSISFTKTIVASSSFVIGAYDNLVKRRSSDPTKEEEESFEKARKTVTDTYVAAFGNSVVQS